MTGTPRVREDDTTFVVEGNSVRTQCNGVQTDYQDNVAAAMDIRIGHKRSTFDIVTDNFHERIARGEIINNPFNGKKWTYSSANVGSWSWTRNATCSGTTDKSWAGNSLRYFNTPRKLNNVIAASGASNCVTLAGTQAWGNVVSPQVLGGESMHDREATWQMLSSPLQGVHEFLEKVRRSKKFGHQTAALGAFIANYWLQYRYGLTPLVHDLVNGFDAAVLPRFSDRYTARGSCSAQPVEYGDQVPYAADTYYTGQTQRSNIEELWVRAGVLYRHHFTLGDIWGYSAHNFIPTMWEFLPYSFVADWFVNAGDFLAACVPKANVKVLASWTTQHYKSIQERSLTTTPKTVSGYTVTGGPAFIDTLVYEHTVRSPAAARGLAFRLNDLTFSKSKNWMHFADGLALAGQYLLQRPSSKTPKIWRPLYTRKEWKGTGA